MRNLASKVMIFAKLLIYWLIFNLTLSLSINPAWANTPEPPSPPVLQGRLPPPYPPKEAENAALDIVATGTLKTFPVLADTEVRQSQPNTNYGIEPVVSAGYDNYAEYRLIQRALLHFGLSTFLPPGTTIHQATLRLYMAGYCDAGSSSYQAYRVGSDWSELTTTWSTQPSIAEGYGSTTIPIGGASFGWYSFTITTLVQAWVNGTYSEYGLMLRGPEAAPPQCAFREFLSKGGGGYDMAPEVVVDYTLPAPAMTLSTKSANFFLQCGVGAPALTPKTITLQTNTSTLNNWSASVSGGGGWLSVSKTSGKVSRILPEQLVLSVSETLPCPSVQTAQITVTGSGLGGSPQTITVMFAQGTQPPASLYLPFLGKNSTGSSNLPPVTTSPDPNRIALVVGVADYQYLFPPATFTVFRPGFWGDDLLAPRGDNFSAQQAFRVDGYTMYVLSEENATRENVRLAFQRIDEIEGPDTDVLFLFTGHGGQTSDASPADEADNQDEFIGVYDTNDTPQLTNFISDDDLKAWLGDLETQHLAVILDSCRSGGMEVTNTYRAVLAASQEDQDSWETSELEHGVFSYYFLKALQDPASDANADGWVSVQEVYDYTATPVFDYVMNNTSTEQNLVLDITQDFKIVRRAP